LICDRQGNAHHRHAAANADDATACWHPLPGLPLLRSARELYQAAARPKHASQNLSPLWATGYYLRIDFWGIKMNRPAYVYRCKVERIVDGDTVDLLIDLGFSTHVAARVRLYGIDAPELKGKTKTQGLASKAYLEKLLKPWQLDRDGLLCCVHKRKAASRGTDKYGRWLVVLWGDQESDGTVNTINHLMLEAGHASSFILD